MKRLFCEHNIRISNELSGAWRFLTDPNDVGETEGWQNGLPTGDTVIVPSVWNNELRLLNYEGAGWYEKKFTTTGGTLRFEFGSVMTLADIWLDGEKVFNHYGAFTQFDFILNNIEAGEHTLIVRADNRQNEKSIPQKRVDWFNYGGIARDVYFDELNGICVLQNHVKYTLSEDLKVATIFSDLVLYNASDKSCASNVTIAVGENEIYNGEVSLSAYETMTLKTPEAEIPVELWSVESPKLYTVVAKTETDDLIDRIGFRLIETKNCKVYLNKKEVEFRGVNRHEEHPEWGFAFPAKLMKRDIDMILDLGCNTIRGSHYPQSQIFVDMLDERGIMFWSEIPIWGCGFSEAVLQDPDVVERGMTMHREMVKYYFNHPSIVIWGMHNEVWTPWACVYDITKKYHDFLRSEGGNRLITHATLCPNDDPCFEFDDIISINQYHGWYYGGFDTWDRVVNELRERRIKLGMADKPVIYSEFGAGALAGYHVPFDSVRWSEEYQRDILKYTIELFHKDPMVVGFYIWQFTNIRTSPTMDLNRVRCFNNKGIVDEYRNPKLAYYTVRDLYNRYKDEENA